MNSGFNIITTVTYRIECILKAVIEFMLSQMTKSKSNSIIIFYSDGIIAFGGRIRGRPYFSMLVLVMLWLSHLRRLGSTLFHSIITKGTKGFLKRLCLV